MTHSMVSRIDPSRYVRVLTGLEQCITQGRCHTDRAVPYSLQKGLLVRWLSRRKDGQTHGTTDIRKVSRTDMGGKEKALSIANVPKFQGLDKKPLSCGSLPEVPPAAGAHLEEEEEEEEEQSPPAPSSKVAGLNVIRNRSNSLRHGKLAFFHYLERVETMRCFWELKHVEQQVEFHQVCDRAALTFGVQRSAETAVSV
ncbi:hypothetical protein SKAU_G00089080 [Synaphobranchus kaupii]|uniref:Uncharacterized protein n=1 Tax=Synaphobranchus kaupii TaxID=118154 RepID=A0A9Q1J446_SYNKA|nr:hypothetical protein SKAU_G00089080 [Synaphobranchus kaupii]